MQEFTSAVEEMLEGQEAEETGEKPSIKFKLDGREMTAFYPTDGQLVFMLAATGRGQSDDGRLAAITNVMLASLKSADRDYFEQRLLESDEKKALSVKMLEQIFEYLVAEWFGRPTSQP